MSAHETYRIVNREVIKLGREATLDRLFQEWVYPDLRQVAPHLMSTAHTFRPVGGGRANVLYFTAAVDQRDIVNFGALIKHTLLQARSEEEVNTLYGEFYECLESVDRLSLVEVM